MWVSSEKYKYKCKSKMMLTLDDFGKRIQMKRTLIIQRAYLSWTQPLSNWISRNWPVHVISLFPPSLLHLFFSYNCHKLDITKLHQFIYSEKLFHNKYELVPRLKYFTIGHFNAFVLCYCCSTNLYNSWKSWCICIACTP